MVDNALYVFDEMSNFKKLTRYCAKKNIRKIFLCPMTTKHTSILVVKRLCSLINCEATIIPFVEHFNKIAFSERDNFIRFLLEFAEKPRFGSVNFKEYFKYPHSLFSVWWLSLISEKSPQTSDSYHNLIKLLTILKLIKECECKRILLDIESAELSYTIIDNSRDGGYVCEAFRKHRLKSQIICLLINFLKAIKYYFYSIYKIFIVTVNARSLGFRKEILKNAQYIAITYFPLIDRESLRQERFVNEYYGLLQTALENKYKDKFIWLAMTPGINGFSFKDSIKLGRQINMWSYPLYFLEEWITLKDLFIIMAHYICFTMKCIIKIPYLSKKFEYSKKPINIWRIFKEDWFSSFAGSALMSGIFHFRAFKNISNNLKKGVVVIYLAENHTWERALNFNLHENKDFRSIGILHTAVPLLFLQLFDSRDGSTKGGETGLTMPGPDYLACNGKIPLKLFQARGWNEKEAFLWFAIRYQHLKRHLQRKIPWESRQNKILVVLSSSAKESRELLCYIHQAFIGRRNYQVIIKAHYSLAAHPLIRHINLDFDKNTFLFSDEKLDKFLPLVKAMVMAGSTSALESIAFACPVIIPRLSGVIDMNPLSGISDLPIYVSSPKELQATVDEIIKRKDSPVSHDKCRDFIENYFEFANSENELIEKIENCFVTVAKTL